MHLYEFKCGPMITSLSLTYVLGWVRNVFPPEGNDSCPYKYQACEWATINLLLSCMNHKFL